MSNLWFWSSTFGIKSSLTKATSQLFHFSDNLLHKCNKGIFPFKIKNPLASGILTRVFNVLDIAIQILSK